MQQSNTYIIGFIVVLCIIVGGLLAGANKLLGPAQQKSIEFDTKSQILNAVKNQVTLGKNADVLAVYNARIQSLVVDYDGNEVKQDEKGNPIEAEKVDILRNYKKKPEERLYPVFKLIDEKDKDKIEAYIVPVYGNGLWDKIWGYVALDSKIESIVGASFDHKAETPGLGQRIATDEIQGRFVGKKIYDESGKLVSVRMMKGEHGGEQASIEYYKDKQHEVDGMSGATLTGKGLNVMLASYFASYQNYFKKVKDDSGSNTAMVQ